ncbi:exported hypothetical protein [Candidatus Terasakiella magnetica]|uniref:Solute-binding protein family 3/N-terminal domain-containing protein n=1 Tax=Candidatus Terasakiella magnetica TaxID=1867952 RepID=A0A1C3RDX1_9PROT|nr:transporter substrate-binding domain-containing protein [Candidatus Terasakiella magnetica]SCA55469.1 exported hypothetical protein [Candidatus Terasakiella magnetica]
MKRYFILIFCFSLICGLKSANALELRVSSISYPPLVEDEQKGIVVALTNAALAETSYEATFRLYPWARALNFAVKGRSDAITPVFKSEEREKNLLFHQTPLFSLDMMLFRPHFKGDEFEGTVASISNSRVAFIVGTQLNADFDAAKTDGRLIPIFVNSLDQQMKLLKAERVDYVVAEQYAGKKKLHELGLSKDIKTSRIPITSNPIYIALSKKSSTSLTPHQIDKAIAKIQKNGRYQKILESYLSAP